MALHPPSGLALMAHRCVPALRVVRGRGHGSLSRPARHRPRGGPHPPHPDTGDIHTVPRVSRHLTVLRTSTSVRSWSESTRVVTVTSGDKGMDIKDLVAIVILRYDY